MNTIVGSGFGAGSPAHAAETQAITSAKARGHGNRKILNELADMLMFLAILENETEWIPPF
jgi:hypothetical protein